MHVQRTVSAWLAGTAEGIPELNPPLWEEMSSPVAVASSRREGKDTDAGRFGRQLQAAAPCFASLMYLWHRAAGGARLQFRLMG